MGSKGIIMATDITSLNPDDYDEKGRRIAKALGLDTEFHFVIDLLDFDRTLEGMASTRSYFRALQKLFEGRGVKLEKIGYTEEMLLALTSDAIDLERIGELYFDRIEDRLMGLVPHEFKALLLSKP